MRKTLVLLGVGLAGIVVGAGANYVGAQSAGQVTRTELLRKPISGIEGKEVIVSAPRESARRGSCGSSRA